MTFTTIPDLKQKGIKLIEYMKSLDYKIDPMNIVYIEDFDAEDWKPLPEKLDFFNDVRCIIGSDGQIYLSCWATTEPGRYYTENRMNPAGAFRIAFGQHINAWAIGMHKGQDALVQVAPIAGFRDGNEDGLRIGDTQVKGIFGINQHTTGLTFNNPKSVGRWSAGCLVGQNTNTHYNRFMPLVRSFKRDFYSTTIIDGTKFWQFIHN